MWYKPDINSSSFQYESFQPKFKFTEEEEAQAQQLCGSNTECRYDYLITGNEAAASAALSASETNNQASSTTCEFFVVKFLRFIIPVIVFTTSNRR